MDKRFSEQIERLREGGVKKDIIKQLQKIPKELQLDAARKLQKIHDVDFRKVCIIRECHYQKKGIDIVIVKNGIATIYMSRSFLQRAEQEEIDWSDLDISSAAYNIFD